MKRSEYKVELNRALAVTAAKLVLFIITAVVVYFVALAVIGWYFDLETPNDFLNSLHVWVHEQFIVMSWFEWAVAISLGVIWWIVFAVFEYKLRLTDYRLRSRAAADKELKLSGARETLYIVLSVFAPVAFLFDAIYCLFAFGTRLVKSRTTPPPSDCRKEEEAD